MKDLEYRFRNTLSIIIIVLVYVAHCDGEIPTAKNFTNISETFPFTITTTLNDDSYTSSMFLSEEEKYCSGNCTFLPASCYNCSWNNDCHMGERVTFNCTVKYNQQCIGKVFQKNFQCLYCYLTKPYEEHMCKQTNTSCKVNATPRQRVKGNCTVAEGVFCLGNRTFTKMMPCSWTSGYSWSTALALSITVGGFGVDRFYLGYWREGLGKFFSFGGLGVWTLVDVVLIGTSYLGPSNGSLYVS